jgi:proteasome accessory factor C
VSIRLAEYFERPLRLTPAEGVALVAAARALLAVPGSDRSGPLATALAKLEEAVGSTGGLAVQVDAADHLDRLREAAANGDQIEIEYYSSARDEMTTRVVDPIRVFHALGAWYLGAWCHRAQGERLFRIDRVRAVRPTGERVEVREGASAGGDADLVYRPAPDDLRVRLRLAPEAAWVAESIPVEERTARARGRIDVVIAVSGRAFLERLLLSLGPAAQVLGPPEAEAIRAEAARRVLACYDEARRP